MTNEGGECRACAFWRDGYWCCNSRAPNFRKIEYTVDCRFAKPAGKDPWLVRFANAMLRPLGLILKKR